MGQTVLVWVLPPQTCQEKFYDEMTVEQKKELSGQLSLEAVQGRAFYSGQGVEKCKGPEARDGVSSLC